MQKLLLVLLVIGVVSTLLARFGQAMSAATAAEKANVPVIHNVFFSLKDKSEANSQKLVDACKKYLSKQPGITYFSCGVLAKDLNRPVNDLDWDVGLHIAFTDKAAHDKYQDDAEHKKFIDENKENWAKVRVFDTLGK